MHGDRLSGASVRGLAGKGDADARGPFGGAERSDGKHAQGQAVACAGPLFEDFDITGNGHVAEFALEDGRPDRFGAKLRRREPERDGQERRAARKSQGGAAREDEDAQRRQDKRGGMRAPGSAGSPK
ncbi:MAG: hypothetical protein A49_15560 [Methyloceanibacter sp.]|nr:MAG: hypothetical protein A49_15560 [Methyloceanibacter sp.]